MSDSWFYAQDGQQKGPISSEELRAAVARGTLSDTDLVWRDGMDQWTPIAQIQELAATAAKPAVAVGILTPPPAQVSYFTPVHHPVYAGFWLRFVAHLVDSFIMGVGSFILQMIMGFLIMATGGLAVPVVLLFLPLFFVGPWLYYAMMESSTSQATLGKLALGLRVVDERGGRISFGQATGRFFGKILSGLILCIGYMMAGWTQRKQALHDMLASTLVMRS